MPEIKEMQEIPSFKQMERLVAATERIAMIDGESGLTAEEMSLASSFLAARTGKVWATKFWTFATNSTSAGIKLLDNADMADPTPATDTVEGVDPYLDYNVFRWWRCNYRRDDDGTARLVAMEGWPGYKTRGAADVGVLSPTFYWKVETNDAGGYYTFYFSDSPHPELGLVPWCEAVKADGTVLPYYIESAYASVVASDGLLRSQPGAAPAYDQSYNSQLTAYPQKGAGYHGSGMSRNTLQIIMLAIKYATKNSQTKFTGCTNYNKQVTVAHAEENVTRVLLPESESTFWLAGLCVSVGDNAGTSLNQDRGNVTTHNIADRVLIKSVETVSVDGTSYCALNLDIDTPFSTTETTFVSSMPCWSGITDNVIGMYDGSPVSNSDGKHTYRIKGIEYLHGQAIVAADTVMALQSDYTAKVYAAEKGSTRVSSDIESVYKYVGTIPDGEGSGGNFWIGDVAIDEATGVFYPKTAGTGNQVGCGDQCYSSNGSTSGYRGCFAGGHIARMVNAGSAFADRAHGINSPSWAYASAD